MGDKKETQATPVTTPAPAVTAPAPAPAPAKVETPAPNTAAPTAAPAKKKNSILCSLISISSRPEYVELHLRRYGRNVCNYNSKVNF